MQNTLITLSDSKIGTDNNADNTADFYTASVLSATDYYAFGMSMKERSWQSESYRYGFNGKEKDTDWEVQDYGFRIYKPELGKFLSVDPLAKDFPWNSAYAFAENDVIRSMDLDGLEKFIMNLKQVSEAGSVKIKKTDDFIIYKITLHYETAEGVKIPLSTLDFNDKDEMIQTNLILFENVHSQANNNNQLRDGHIYKAKWIKYRSRDLDLPALHFVKDLTTGGKVGGGGVVVHDAAHSGDGELIGCKSVTDETQMSRGEKDNYENGGSDLIPAKDKNAPYNKAKANTINALKQIRDVFEAIKRLDILGNDQVLKGKGDNEKTRKAQVNAINARTTTFSNDIEHIEIHVEKDNK